MKHILKTTSYIFLSLAILLHSHGADQAEAWPEPSTYDLSFKATAEMKEFLSHPSLDRSYNDVDRARSIVKLLFGPDGKGFTYDPELTLAPVDAFRERKGNCITFAMLFTTLARSIGMHTHFNEINSNPGWNQNRNLIIETGHVNVVVTSGWRNFIVEWLDSYRDLSMLAIQTIDDDKIRSDFYNNLGIQALAVKDYATAQDYINYAKHVYRKNPSIWQNEGVMWLHMGDPEKAETSFLSGLEYSGSQSSIYFLLSKLYSQQGKDRLASRYFKKGERYARKNPFYHYQLAMEDFEDNAVDKAMTHLKRAISKLPDYHLFHFTKAKYHQARGEHKLWKTELNRAITLTQTPEIIQRYQAQLQEFQTSQLDIE